MNSIPDRVGNLVQELKKLRSSTLAYPCEQRLIRLATQQQDMLHKAHRAIWRVLDMQKPEIPTAIVKELSIVVNELEHL